MKWVVERPPKLKSYEPIADPLPAHRGPLSWPPPPCWQPSSRAHPTPATDNSPSSPKAPRAPDHAPTMAGKLRGAHLDI
ncbi:hypothetical protein ECTHUN299_52820 [Escherichia coli]|nr:hypothetical protein ECTHUN299_52820 [Escherichia coli]